MTTSTATKTTSKPKLIVNDVSVTFGAGTPAETRVLDNVSLTVAEGEFVTIIGPSGCGKSSLLNVVTSIVRPTSGTVMLRSNRSGRGERVGYTFQKDTLLPWKTVADNIALPLRIRGVRDRAHVSDLIAKVGLTGFDDHFPRQLSGGMRKRGQVAALLAQDAELMLMDEPFGALDAQTKLILQLEFLQLWEERRKTVLFVTHDLNEAILMSDRIVVMSSRPGRLLFSETVTFDRPRAIEEIVGTPEYREVYNRLWESLRHSAHEEDDYPVESPA